MGGLAVAANMKLELAHTPHSLQLLLLMHCTHVAVFKQGLLNTTCCAYTSSTIFYVQDTAGQYG